MTRLPIATAADFRHELMTNPRLRLEYLASVSRLLREHQYEIDDSLLSTLSVATEAELNDGLSIVSGPHAPAAVAR